MANVDIAGNTLGVALDLGSVSGSKTVSDFVGSTDTVDFFRFSLNTASDFDISLNRLSANAEVALIQDRNLNCVIDADEYVGLSNRFGTAKDTIDINSLPAGTYYAGVYYSGGDTNYNLYLSATPPGKTFNSNFGYGLVDAATAVAFVTGTSPFPEVANLGGLNWGLDMIEAPEVWQQGYTGQGITVAVLDAGVDSTHPDLDNNIWINSDEIYGNGIDDDKNGYVDDVNGWDFVDGDNLPYDTTPEGHGTHVAGLIAAENNGVGTTGVAYNAKIMPVKMDSDDEIPLEQFDTLLANGINYAVANGANVLNMSLGNYPGEPLMPKTMEALANAKRSGVVAVMASGNERITDNTTRPIEPASYAAIDLGIAVGAVNAQNILEDYTNPAGVIPIDYVVAPGDEIYSTTPGNTYGQLSRTSMSTAYVSGVAALLLGANPSLSPSEVEMAITRTANPVEIPEGIIV